ncbi:MAG TPA: phosphate ABC transporter substrate-binding protein PstS family protein [Alkalispirochaeta sp.]|nr:phosphate ABC transporter substrate-binding protein PstS family protein [Alkalispirochaeta sp.]
MKQISTLMALLLVAGLVFAGGQQEATTDTAAAMTTGWEWVIDEGDFPQVNALEVEGPINTAGSSTVFPAAEYLAAMFQDEGYSGNITIDSIGSGGGYERFAAGESDVSNASRAIRDSEIEAAQEIGRDPIEFRIGTDALAVVTNPENDWVTNASIEELAQIMTAERWSDVNPDWPDEAILRFIPGTDSGTFDYFVEAVFDEDEEPILAASNIQLSEDDNILVQGIEGSPYSIGFFGYAYYDGEGDRLNILSIDGVEANTENVDNGTYPLARPLFMYSDAVIMREKPQVAAWLAYVLNNAEEGMLGVGYFKAPEAAIDNAKQSWLDAVGDMY